MARYFVSHTGRVRYYVATGKPYTDKTSYGESVERVPTAELEVHAGESFPNFDEHGISQSYYRHIGITHPHLYRVGDYVEENPPTTLFTHTPAEIHGAFSDPRMQYAVPTLLAMAHKEHRNLQPSASLSPHSSRLARKALAMGLITPHPHNPSADVINDIGFMEQYSTAGSIEHDDFYREIPSHEVIQAKDYLRGLLRKNKGRRKQSMGPQFQQETLPGVDW